MLEEYVVVDIETTGLQAGRDKIIEIGAIKIKKDSEPEIYNVFVNPGMKIPKRIVELTGITDDMVSSAATIEEIISDFIVFTEDLPLIGHNLIFDYGFLKTAAINQKNSFEKFGIDTLKIARKYLADLESKRLEDLCHYFGIEDKEHHRACNDANVTKQLYQILCQKFENVNENEEKDFKPQPLQFSVKKESPITQKQIAFLQSLIVRHGISMDVEITALTKSKASKMIDGIILRYGR